MNSKTRNIWKWISILFFCYSCQNQPHNINEYKAWFNDINNGFVKEKNIDNLNIRVQYRPVELMMLNDLLSFPSATQNQIDSVRKGYGKSLYFMLEIGYKDKTEKVNTDVLKENTGNYIKYAEKVKELSFGMQENVWLVSGNDTVYPSLYHYERGYELGKKEAFLFAFPRTSNLVKETVFIYNDKIFGTGINKFQLDIGHYNIPPLPLKPVVPI